MTGKALLALIILFRCINSVLVQTFFDPDEYWQSLEVAHKVVFGYGYLTWEWQIALRSFLHPAIFAALYKLISLLQLDYPIILIVAPKLLQGLFAAIGDFALFHYTKNQFGTSVGRWTLICSLSSWFMFDVIVRTYSNSLEAVLFQLFLYFWPSRVSHKNESRPLALFLAAVTVIIRPTSALLWIWYGVSHLVVTKHKIQLIGETFIVGGLTLALALGVDFWFYDRLVLPPWEFLKFNVLQGGASIYGTHPWHWYFTAATPTILTSLLLPFGLCIFRTWTQPSYQALLKTLFAPMLFFVGILSLTPHKEFRFLLPILPLALIACGVALRDAEESFRRKGKNGLFKWILLLIFLPQLLMSGYFASVHQRGTTDVMHYLQSPSNIKANSTVFFLMPCHSTPYNAYVHRDDISLRFLDCSPNLSSPSAAYLDEADRFYQDPIAYLEENAVARDDSMVLIMFTPLATQISAWLQQNSFSKAAEFFHAHLSSGRVGGSVYVFQQ